MTSNRTTEILVSSQLSRHDIPFERNSNGKISAIDAFAADSLDTLLKDIAQLTELERLSCHCSDLSDIGLNFVYEIKSLRQFDLSQTQVTDKGIAAIGELAALEKLVATNLSGDLRDFFEGLQSLRQLFSIDLRSSGVTDQHISQLERIESCSLEDTDIGDAGLLKLASPNKLELLNVSSTKTSSSGLTCLLDQSASLKTLFVSGIEMGDANVDAVSNLGELQMLFCTKNNLSDLSLRAFKHLQKLETLYLHDTQVTSKGLSVLDDLPLLKRLTLPSAITARQRVRISRRLKSCSIDYY